MRDLARRFKLAPLFVLAGVALVAVPAVQGAPPTRNVYLVPGPRSSRRASVFVRSLKTVVGHRAVTEFADGRTVTIAHGDVTLTNGDASYLQVSRFQATDTFPDADTLVSVGDGRYMIQFYPGDQGPFGEVGENGALYAFVGTSSFTADLNTFLITSFSYRAQ